MSDTTNPATDRQIPDTAVTTGARAVAAFADQNNLHIPDDLREDLAYDVITAARPHLTGTGIVSQTDGGETGTDDVGGDQVGAGEASG